MDVIKRNNNIVLRNIHSLYYLVDIKCNYNNESHSIPTLNEVGKVIWESIEKPTKLDDVVKKVITSFDISGININDIKSDVIEYISLLIKMGYVENVY